MTWASFYLICFLVGLFLSAFALLGGMGHFGGGHVHVPHLFMLTHAAHPRMRRTVRITWLERTGVERAHAAQSRCDGAPWWNAFSMMVFLCWFGAAGYLLTRFGSFVAGVVVVLAAICGVIGGAIIFLFLTRVS